MPNGARDGRTVYGRFLTQGRESDGNYQHGECECPSATGRMLAKRHESTRSWMLNSERRNSQSRRPEMHLTIVVKRATTTAPKSWIWRSRSTIEADSSAGGRRRARAQSHSTGQKKH